MSIPLPFRKPSARDRARQAWIDERRREARIVVSDVVNHSDHLLRLACNVLVQHGETPEERRARTVSHVLGKFSAADRPVLETVLAEVEAGIDLIRRLGLERAANRLNLQRDDFATWIYLCVGMRNAWRWGSGRTGPTAPSRQPRHRRCR